MIETKEDAVVRHCQNDDRDYKMADDNADLTSKITAGVAVTA